MFTAFCIHACQSLREAFQTLDDYEPGKDATLKPALDALPFGDLINDVRQHDIHGHPLPVCEPGAKLGLVMSRPGSPVRLQTGDTEGSGVQVQMHGAEPVVTIIGDSPKARLIPGQTISYHCEDGELCVWDYRTKQTVRLVPVLSEFLTGAHQLLVAVCEARGVALQSGGEESDDVS